VRQRQRRASVFSWGLYMPTFVVPFEDQVLSEPDAAKFCGCSKDTIRRRIKAGDGPPVIRLSSHRIGYRVRDLRAWLDANTEARS
jgi:predicted DNA-binding transcriptional regulator AlpA